MKKQKMLKSMAIIFFATAAILAVGFILFMCMDFVKYNPMQTSAPLYVYALVRGLEFLLPSVVTLIIALFLRKKIEK